VFVDLLGYTPLQSGGFSYMSGRVAMAISRYFPLK
jgi:hypothetical protein